MEAAYQETSDPLLAFQLATLSILEEDYGAAIAYYRRTLAGMPDSFIVRNELSILLTLAERRTDEALQVLGPAIESAGPLPGLVDTRAMLRIAAGAPEAAIDDLAADSDAGAIR